MPRKKITRKPCRACERVFDVKELSKSKLCRECADKLMLAAIIDLQRKFEPYYEKWKAGVRRALEGQRIQVAPFCQVRTS